MNIPVLIDMSSVDINSPLGSMADRLSAAGQTLVLGMLAVFGVLASLWVVLIVMGKFFTAKKDTPKDNSVKEAPATAPTVHGAAPADDEEEIVAAITAAISVMLDKPQSAFRVVSFKQTSREAFRRNNSSKN